MLVTQRRINEEDNQRGQRRDTDVDKSPQALPTSALRIIKNRFGQVWLIDNRMPWAAGGQFGGKGAELPASIN
jgi:hypothetical protein